MCPPPLFLHTGNHGCVVCSYDSNIVQPDVLAFLKGQMTTLVPDSSMCNLLLEGTMVPLAVFSPKWEPHPSWCICKDWRAYLAGVMVDPEAHCLPAATCSRLRELGSPFLVILVPSSCSSSATLSASYGGELGALASLWLSVTLSGASGARPGIKVRGEDSE